MCNTKYLSKTFHKFEIHSIYTRHAFFCFKHPALSNEQKHVFDFLLKKTVNKRQHFCFEKFKCEMSNGRRTDKGWTAQQYHSSVLEPSAHVH